jgi:PAS domain S-box-containing protein
MAKLSEEITRLKSKESDGARMLQEMHKNLSLSDEERKKIHSGLNASKEQLRSIIDQAPGSLAMFDRQMRYLSVSRRWLSDYKLGERDLIGLSHYDVFPEISEDWKNIHRRVLAGEVIRAEEDRFERADGSVQYLRWEVRPWQISPGDIGGIIIYSEDITERKQAEHEIEQSRASMVWVLEQVGIGTWFNELPFGHLNWDKQTKSLFFVTTDAEPTIELFWNHLHEDDHEPTRRAVEEAIRNRTTYSIEHRAVNPKTGEVRWIRSIGKATYSEDGTPARFDGINYDITQYKRAEEALRASECQYRRLVETSNDGIWVIDNENGTSFVNKRMAEMLGCTVQEMSGASLFDFMDSDVEAVARSNVERRRQGIAEQHDFKFRRKDGSCFWALVSTNPIHDERGNYLGALAMITDITERKRTEDALRASEQRLHLALDAGYLISFEWDIARNEVQRFVSKDPALPPTSGQPTTLEEFLNIVHPEDRKRFTANVFASMQRVGGRYENEFRIMHPDGKVRWLHETGFFEHDLQNRPIRLIGLSQDITDRKRAELELLQLNENLEQVVADRTALADERSKQLQALAVELLEAEEREKQRIAGLLHEDLQQLLAAARFKLESKHLLDPDLKQVQNLLEESISKARHLSRELSPAVLHHYDLTAAIE